MGCSKCKNPLLAEDELSCVICGRKFHFGCAGMYERNYRRLIPSAKSSWKCNSCLNNSSISGTNDNISDSNDQLIGNPASDDPSTASLKCLLTQFSAEIRDQAQSNKDELKGLITSLGSKVDACVAGLQSLTTRVDKIKNDFDTKYAAVNERLNTLESAGSDPSGSRECPLNVEDSMAEIEERRRRASNVILFDIPESATADAVGAAGDDLRAIEEALSKLKPEFSGLVDRFFRIGRVNQDKVRPLKVIFDSPSTATKVLATNRATHPRLLSISSDKTPTQQAYLTKLRNTLKSRMEAGENNLTIRYVSGVPRIVTLSSNHLPSQQSKNGNPKQPQERP
ncbi:hypothetical protein GE061_003780 [Apolygus lucorum]|uniref:Zinc finger PHD-type domain-containing protein n=1 Tax=Apolygus lucorum TaxID=248454 RepID=A0A8S9X304_APOLU|nr:hypothetical protein GE061_003780 [Apolygus lucorum]